MTNGPKPLFDDTPSTPTPAAAPQAPYSPPPSPPPMPAAAPYVPPPPPVMTPPPAPAPYPPADPTQYPPGAPYGQPAPAPYPPQAAPAPYAPPPVQAPPAPMAYQQPPVAQPQVYSGQHLPAAGPVSLPTRVNEQWIAQLGHRESESVARVSRALLEHTKASDADQFGLKLNELIVTAKGLSPSQLNSKGLFSKIKNMFGSIKEQFLAQYNSVAKQIERFTVELHAQAKLQQRRIDEMDQMYEANYQEHQRLGVALEDGARAAEEMKAALAGIDLTGLDNMQAQKVADARSQLARLEKRLDDLKRIRMLAEQTAPQIRLMQENARLLVSKFHDIVNLTIPAWQKQFALQIMLLEQQRGAELATAVDDATNEALRRNADLLRQNNQQIVTASQRAVIDIETLEHVNQQIIGALEDARRIVDEGQERRKQTDSQLEGMRSQLLTVMQAQGKPL